MKLGRYLTKLTKPELNELREQLNLTLEETVVFDELSKGNSNQCISDLCCCSVATIGNRVRDIKDKIERVV